MSNRNKSYTTNSVTSKDGTKIGYRQMGSGPGIILLHGGVNASQHFMKLGAALSDAFTVYIPDRRGRGLSGPYGKDYSIKREVEDLDALRTKTGAYYLFGASTGALIILQSTLTVPGIRKIALYEPLLYVNKSDMDKFNAMIRRYDKEVSEGKLAAAMVAASKTDDPTSAIAKVPSFLLLILFTLILRIDAMIVKGDDVQLKDLMPTLDYDIELVNETEGKLENFREVSVEVLLLGGSKSELMLKDSLDALRNVLPHVNRIELLGLDHKSAMNSGKPKRIAQELRRFFI
ncbi:MAG TPA: alpha/beta hydrolase [Nitrospirota bacterium]|nr:alpha/beta hydrolase [Nitrospirota bacterium]